MDLLETLKKLREANYVVHWIRMKEDEVELNLTDMGIAQSLQQEKDPNDMSPSDRAKWAQRLNFHPPESE